MLFTAFLLRSPEVTSTSSAVEAHDQCKSEDHAGKRQGLSLRPIRWHALTAIDRAEDSFVSEMTVGEQHDAEESKGRAERDE